MIERRPANQAVVSAFLLGGCALAPVLAPPVGAEPLEVGLALGASHYDHRSSFGGPTSFNLRSIRPHVRYVGDAGGWDVDGLAQRRFEFYSGVEIDSVFRSGDHSHDRVRLEARRRFTPLDEVRFEGGYTRSQDLLDADQGTVVVDGTVTRWAAEAGTELRYFEGEARVRRTSYGGRPDLQRGRALGWAARVVPIRQRIHTVFAGVRESRLEVGGQNEIRSRGASAGVRRRLDPIYTVSLEAGAVEHRLPDGARLRKPAFGLALERDPGRPHALELGLSAHFEGDSISALGAEARWRLASGRLWLRAEAAGDAEGGIFQSATQVRRLVAGVTDTLGRANVLGFEGSYAHARPLFEEGERTEIVRMTGWALRRIQPWLNGRIAVSYLREPMKARYQEPIFRRFRVDAELIVLHSSNQSGLFHRRGGPPAVGAA
jgi:hypothetical protein